ncbi:hypothetical protein GCM10009677_26190 [Sphaerisporangium rubeum]|uniref:Anti-sigma regulatory factor (Ser/Thr protein kinase) n=1 Tax=Sphaerisporangium rubeum TaxID=321317 RepID=A0A7X0I9X3_9ACTN|nr:ATP-binding protein [Sphaerisporangium rubeum]MBB6471330.1 anti-sigma regulatory factor (Ser/Thr protein kinase) [Sphaerisporangium rubeum]
MTLTGPPLSKSITLIAILESAGTARRFIRDVLGDRYPAVEVVVLLTSELMANAVRHSRSGSRDGGQVTVTVEVGVGVVRVDVVDEGSELEVPVVVDRGDVFCEGGRGLWLVRELAAEWGWGDGEQGRRTVWFRVGARR